MMKLKTLLAATAGTVLAVTGATVVLASPGQADASTSSAYGFQAKGVFPFEPMPAISSSDGRLKRSSAGSVPDNPLLQASIADLYAGNRKAGITVADVAVGGGLLDQVPAPPPELTQACQDGLGQVPELPELPELGSQLPLPVPETPKQLADLCDLLLTPPSSLLGVELIKVQCDGNRGDVTVADLSVLGQKVSIPSTAPNTEIPADPLLHVTINKQTRNADGSFTVSGVVVNLFDGTEVLTLGSATCGREAAGRAPAQAPAEAPTPVVRDLPVTG